MRPAPRNPAGVETERASQASASALHIGATILIEGTFAAVRRFPYLSRPHSGHSHIPICGPLE
jgi:hypothetical protein